jgi:ribosomal protein S18 acetylase RimI-like enzyme
VVRQGRDAGVQGAVERGGLSDTPVIRKAATSDAARMREIARAAYAKYVPRIGREPSPMVANYDAVVAAQHATIIEIGRQVSGYIIAWPADDAYFIENIGVDPQYQGHGLGRRLIKHAVAEARSHGLAALSLYTNEAMTENFAMYTHFGFIETHRVTEEGFRRVYMRWTLPRA